ncbi:MAG: hypothetical protein AAF565_01515 [Pseudomonadota bacterium]
MPSLALSAFLVVQIPAGAGLDLQPDALFFELQGTSIGMTIVDTEAGRAEVSAAEATGQGTLRRFITLGYDVTEVLDTGRNSGALSRIFIETGGETVVLAITAAGGGGGGEGLPAEASADPDAAARVTAVSQDFRDFVRAGQEAGRRADRLRIEVDGMLLEDAARIYSGFFTEAVTVTVEPDR